MHFNSTICDIHKLPRLFSPIPSHFLSLTTFSIAHFESIWCSSPMESCLFPIVRYWTSNDSLGWNPICYRCSKRNISRFTSPTTFRFPTLHLMQPNCHSSAVPIRCPSILHASVGYSKSELLISGDTLKFLSVPYVEKPISSLVYFYVSVFLFLKNMRRQISDQTSLLYYGRSRIKHPFIIFGFELEFYWASSTGLSTYVMLFMQTFQHMILPDPCSFSAVRSCLIFLSSTSFSGACKVSSSGPYNSFNSSVLRIERVASEQVLIPICHQENSLLRILCLQNIVNLQAVACKRKMPLVLPTILAQHPRNEWDDILYQYSHLFINDGSNHGDI